MSTKKKQKKTFSTPDKIIITTAPNWLHRNWQSVLSGRSSWTDEGIWIQNIDSSILYTAKKAVNIISNWR